MYGLLFLFLKFNFLNELLGIIPYIIKLKLTNAFILNLIAKKSNLLTRSSLGLLLLDHGRIMSPEAQQQPDYSSLG